MDPDRIRCESGGARPGARTSTTRTAGALATVALACGLIAAACAESEIGGSLTEKTARMALSHEVPSVAAVVSASFRAVRADVTIDDDPEFVVDSVDVVLREPQAGREGAECAFGAEGTRGDGGDGGECQEFAFQTLVLAPPVNEGFDELVSNQPVLPGTWNQFVFRLLPLQTGHPEHTQILNDRPELRDASVRVTGTFDGEEFELLLTPEGEVVVEAASPVTLDDGDTGGMTIVWRVGEWFDDGEGGVINPIEAQDDDALAGQIEANILEGVGLVVSSAG